MSDDRKYRSTRPFAVQVYAFFAASKRQWDAILPWMSELSSPCSDRLLQTYFLQMLEHLLFTIFCFIHIFHFLRFYSHFVYIFIYFYSLINYYDQSSWIVGNKILYMTLTLTFLSCDDTLFLQDSLK